MSNRKISLFFLGYSLYFMSLFIPDININGLVFYKAIRYISYIILILHIVITNRYNRKSMMRIILFASFAGGIALLTHDIYYLAISIIVLASLYEDVHRIMNTSFEMLLFCSIFLAILTMLGIVENMSFTIQGGIIRWGLGYYHSNVFPMIVFFLFSWRMIVNGKLNSFENCLLLISALSVYIWCRSRNGLISCGVLAIYAYLNNKHSSNKFSQERKSNFIMRFAYKYSILIMTILSLSLTVFNGNYISSIYKINRLFSGRFALAYHKLNDVGLHLINFMTNDVYAESQIVIDNGYLYVILRYGLVFILFYAYIQYLICKKYDKLICIVFAITSVASMVDNDLFSYGFLPYILLAFNQQESFTVERINDL